MNPVFNIPPYAPRSRLVANYRTIFSGDIRQGGLDKLIEKLASGNERLLSSNKESG